MADTKHQRVTFTRQQIEYLERVYPEVVGSHETTEAEYRYRAGQRSVLLFLRGREQTITEATLGMAQ